MQHALSHQEGLICVAAALMLKNNKKRLPEGARKEMAQKIAELLRDDVVSRWPLDAPEYRFKRLDDVLFGALRELIE